MKRASFLLICIVLWCTAGSAVYAADGVPQIDAVLVLDASNSMNASDPHKISIDAMKMFIDMLSVQNDKVGVVSYTDQIEREKAMTTIRNSQDKESVKDFISQLKRGAYTDITLGLDEAIRMMDDAHDPAHKPVIILLTDGNIELDARKGKTLDDAARDTERIIAAAQDKSYPIYTIGLNYDGNLNRQYLQDIADSTQALCFETKKADDLPDILSAIFADQMEIKIITTGSLLADGDFETIDVDIPDRNIVEANITFLSSKPVEIEIYDPSGRQLPFDGNRAILTQSQYYSMLKVIAPEQGLWQLRVKGVAGDNIKINFLYSYSFDVRLTLDNLAPTAGDTVQAVVTLLENGQPTGNVSVYQNSLCTLTVTDTDNQQVATYTAAFQNGAFSADFELPEDHAYEITARVEHPNFFRETQATLHAAPKPAAATASPTPAPTATPTQTPATPKPVPEEPEPTAALPEWLWLLGILAAVLVIIALFFGLRHVKKSGRVFTGKLIIEVIDHYTREKSAPQFRNLVAYGRKTHLLDLLSGAGSPSWADVIITPSPDAPSHMPQIIVKCNNPKVKFRKDFMDQDASRGIAMPLKSELTITMEEENKQVKLRYTE